jgi:hypothetical protein
MSDPLRFFVPSSKERVNADAKDEIDEQENKEMDLLSRSVQVIRLPRNEDIRTVSDSGRFDSCSGNPDLWQLDLHETTTKCKVASVKSHCGGFPAENFGDGLGIWARYEGHDPKMDKDDDDVIRINFCFSPRTLWVRMKVQRRILFVLIQTFRCIFHCFCGFLLLDDCFVLCLNHQFPHSLMDIGT